MTEQPSTVYELSAPFRGSLVVEYMTGFNYSMYLNDGHTMIKCELHNDSPDTWTDISISLQGSMLNPHTAQIASLPPKTSLDVTNLLPIEPDPLQLVQLSEGISVFVSITVTIAGNTALALSLPLALMAYDQWPGIRFRPELIASFITPNHPILSRVSVAASKHLARLTGCADLDEYQSQDPNRVRTQIAAVFEALRAEGISYASVPASFEKTGQRVRTVEKVLEEKLATCLDISLLMASCLESLGINPFVVFTQGHCMVGAWLVKDSYPYPSGDDPEYLLKGAADGINEILVLEATTISSASDVTFDAAVQSAMQTLRTQPFVAFVDVYRARLCGVRPLPLRVKGDEGWYIPQQGVEHSSATTEVKEYDRYDLSSYASDDVQLTKFDIWERKLLDFSLRNNLLNMKLGKKIVPLVSFDIDRLEDFLFAGDTLKVMPFPLDKAPDISTGAIYDSTLFPSLQEFVIHDLENKRIHSFLMERELKEALKYVYRASRTSLEENGANNLYLVLGVLKWFETDRSQQSRYAPILLLPIEIVRGAGLSGYVIRTRDEETVLNITLAQLLKQQYGIDLSVLDELPKDASGVDVKKIFAIVRDRIRDHRGWNVLDESMIGLFSFNKFVMWNDIHSNSQKLLANDIISSLVDSRLKIDDSEDNVDAKKADTDTAPADFTIPIDVDSSQLEAVIASGAGKSFILHGPPGTGKSQTITNMIANALYQGKRVLFVAEKMAALSVVQSRLEKIGLAPFCLELHSNKVTKRHFLAQMEAALDIARISSSADFKRLSDEIYAMRRQLIDYIEALHAKGPDGLSLYDCITSYLSLPGDALDIDVSVFDSLDRHTIESLCQRISALDTIFRIVGSPADSQLSDIDIIDGSPECEARLKASVDALIHGLESWSKISDEFSRLFGISVPDSVKGVDWAVRLRQFMANIPFISPDLIALSADSFRLQSITDAVEAGAKANLYRTKLCQRYSGAVLRLRSHDLLRQWEEACGKWVLTRFFAKRSMLKRLSAYGCNVSEQDVSTLISDLQAVEECSAAYAVDADEVKKIFGMIAYPGKENWAKMRAVLGDLPFLSKLISEGAAYLGIPAADAVKGMVASFAFSRDMAEPLPSLPREAKGIIESVTSLQTCVNSPLLDSDLVHSLLPALYRWRGGLPNFKDWYLWCRSRRELSDQHLQPVIEYISSGQHTAAEAAEAFAKGVYRQLARRMIDSTDSLRYFNGLLFDDVISRYRSLTTRFQMLSKQELFCKLATSIPVQSMAAHENSEIGILKRNIKNGGRGTSIRKIIDLIPTLLPKLCPCMLMSPLSVAQYIDLDNDKFDIVIFDEASQMPTSEAVGAIARGKALIVVGDPKQMPPTSFFSTSSVGEDEAYIDDMESILDDCISLSIPSKYLTWHYRSKHESLISFSNSQYYDGRLFTFPSVDDQTSKVTLRKIDGVYDKGRSRSNIQEAQAVVDEVMRRLSDPRLRKFSIGIVSFSKVQQDKIEDLLNEELAKRPDLEAIALGGAEPIFVKNLENVQGDERDVILFSVGYGPDASGKVSMNFGPLNNAGGERRLNVAVSRARYEMIVFTSMLADQIDLRRTNALGVRGLKKFLEYAENGNNTLTASTELSSAHSDDSDVISRQIAEALKAQGYDVKLSVGRSQFRVDVAVIDPQDPSTFMLGILLDGPNYYSTKTVRDREVVQPSVLAMLHWQVMRVWTLDWYERPSEVVNAIIKRLHDISEAKASQSSQDADDDSQDNSFSDVDTFKDAASLPSVNTDDAPIPMVIPTPSRDYVFAQLEDVPQGLTVDDLKSGAYRSQLSNIIRTLVETEQPITNGLIYKRIVRHYGISRVSPRVQDLVDNVLLSLHLFSQPNGNAGITYWTDKSACDCFDVYRVQSDRDIQDVPYPEILNAMRYALEQQIAIEREDLKRLTANLLGYTRKGTNIDASTEYAIQLLLDEGFLDVDGSKVKLASS